MRLLCFMGEEVSPPEEFSEIAVWKMQQRKRDMEDIASGRRTPGEVERCSTSRLNFAIRRHLPRTFLRTFAGALWAPS